MITDAWIKELRDAMYNGTAPTAPGWDAVGTGTTAVAADDTELETELSRQVITTKSTTGDNIINYEANIASGDENGEEISEHAILNAAVAGDMVFRNTFSPITKTSAIELRLKTKITLGDG